MNIIELAVQIYFGIGGAITLFYLGWMIVDKSQRSEYAICIIFIPILWLPLFVDILWERI